MSQRVLTAIVALCVLAPFLIFSDTFMLEVFIVVLSTVAVYEMLNCMGYARNLWIAVPSYLLSVGLPCFARQMDGYESYLMLMFTVFFIYLFYLLTAAVFSKRVFPLRDAALVFATVIYIIFSFSCIILLRDLKYGQYVFLLIFISAWLTDSGAYFIGIKFGRHKLIEDVSPKKTVEGAVGGIVVCVLSFVLYGFIIGLIFEATPRYFPLVIAGVLMSVISQCGDLIASLIKREYKIKDYGWVFPGHGGVMDRFDSIIATAPFLFIVYSASSFFEVFF